MIFMREDKRTSSNYMKYELGVSKKLKFKNLVEVIFQFGLFEFLFKLISPKINIWKLG